ncbi:MAG: glutathione S-transferase family protein [Proteobacteria bacterium]|nr:glutathione S-transferase family protein [Pseudomonadota bacterium]
MGLLVDGVWQDRWYDTSKSGGRFVRKEAQFRDQTFVREDGRYHLYVSYACPWAHRTLIFRALYGLQDVVDVSVVHPFMLTEGWTFEDDWPGATGDRQFGSTRMHQIYTRAQADYTGRVTVPVLWDKVEGRIVNNESAEIIRMFGPEALREEIDAVNARVYPDVNNGVYRCGFATKQEAYDEAVEQLSETLRWLEERMSGRTYLVAETLTEADWRLFTTLIRFDAVYHGHFKCNVRRIADYPNLNTLMRRLYNHPGVAETVHFDHIRWHYMYSHDSINPHRVVSKGPELDLSPV